MKKKSGGVLPDLSSLTTGMRFRGQQFLVRSCRVSRTFNGQPYLDLRLADGVMDRVARKFQAAPDEQRLSLDGAWITATGWVGSRLLPRDLVISNFSLVIETGGSEPKQVIPQQAELKMMPGAACSVLYAEMVKIALSVRDSGLSRTDIEVLLRCEFVEIAVRRALERMYCLGQAH